MFKSVVSTGRVSYYLTMDGKDDRLKQSWLKSAGSADVYPTMCEEHDCLTRSRCVVTKEANVAGTYRQAPEGELKTVGH
jgi:hypothetical protein